MNGLRKMLIRDSGYIDHAYEEDTPQKYLKIGVDHNIDKRCGGSIPYFIIDLLLDYDIETKSAELFKRFPWTTMLDEPRKAVMISMAFQLTVEGLNKFPRALTYMKDGEYVAAALEFADSKIAREQSPARWARNCRQITTGQWS